MPCYDPHKANLYLTLLYIFWLLSHHLISLKWLWLWCIDLLIPCCAYSKIVMLVRSKSLHWPCNFALHDASCRSSFLSEKFFIWVLFFADLENENRRLKEERTCKICMDNEIGVVFLPCGHLICCFQVGLGPCLATRKNLDMIPQKWVSSSRIKAWPINYYTHSWVGPQIIVLEKSGSPVWQSKQESLGMNILLASAQLN